MHVSPARPGGKALATGDLARKTSALASPNPTAPSLTQEAALGLSSEAAVRRLREVGPNEIARDEAKSPWVILGAQFTSPLIWLLLGASLVSAFLDDWIDAVAIAVILVMNAVVGFLQEFRAEKALLALRSMTAPRARVLRDGHGVLVPSRDVVPGDVLLLEAGDVIAADAKLLEAYALSANEAALTGESLPVEKRAGATSATAPLAERSDMVFTGTSLSTGSGRAEVVATGMATELGKIAHLLASAEDSETPLQGRLRRLSRTLLLLCAAIVTIVALLGLIRGVPAMTVFLSAVSLAVAAIPEGLPAIVTIALAVGVQRMAARNVLVRRLPAVEALGCATVICTDKTGTLTTGTMAVREVWGQDHQAVVAAAAACCDADLGEGDVGGTGDPTELAILRAAVTRGIRRDQLEAANPRVAVAPFDSLRKCMSILRRDGVLYVKGAAEMLVERSDAGTTGVVEAVREMATRGLRVLAVAVGDGPEEQHLRMVGLLGLSDPPRTEAIEAVATARRAGIRTVMITGDHHVTATAIAREMGILRSEDNPADVVHARATPDDKLKIVRAWKARGEIVAMTGDGVNDAPALREAHVGVAMGLGGTAVTREASDMVLADDNFASIVAAVREGRGIFENIRKSLLYLLGGNTGELTLMLAAAIIGLPLPLLPLQILWINLVTDGLPALALVMDPPGPDLLGKGPRRPDEPMLGRPEWKVIGLTGLVLGATVLGIFLWALRHRTLPEAQTMAFATMVFAHVFMALAFRSRTKVLWELGPFTNLRLVAVIVASALLQTGLLLVPTTQRLFQIVPLSLTDGARVILLGLLPVSLLEVGKLAWRARRGARPDHGER